MEGQGRKDNARGVSRLCTHTEQEQPGAEGCSSVGLGLCRITDKNNLEKTIRNGTERVSAESYGNVYEDVRELFIHDA